MYEVQRNGNILCFVKVKITLIRLLNEKIQNVDSIFWV